MLLFQKNVDSKQNNGKKATSVCLLQTEIGNAKLTFVFCKRKTESGS